MFQNGLPMNTRNVAPQGRSWKFRFGEDSFTAVGRNVRGLPSAGRGLLQPKAAKYRLSIG